MDQDQNTMGAERTFPPAPSTENNGSGWLFIVAIIGVVALVLLGWYVVGRNSSSRDLSSSVSTETGGSEAVDPITAALRTQGTTDDVTSIEADLTSTDLDSLNDIEQL